MRSVVGLITFPDLIIDNTNSSKIMSRQSSSFSKNTKHKTVLSDHESQWLYVIRQTINPQTELFRIFCRSPCLNCLNVWRFSSSHSSSSSIKCTEQSDLEAETEIVICFQIITQKRRYF